MSTCSQVTLMPWELSSEADARFQRIVKACMALFLIFGIIIPYLPLPEFEKPLPEEPRGRRDRRRDPLDYRLFGRVRHTLAGGPGRLRDVRQARRGLPELEVCLLPKL